MLFFLVKVYPLYLIFAFDQNEESYFLFLNMKSSQLNLQFFADPTNFCELFFLPFQSLSSLQKTTLKVKFQSSFYMNLRLNRQPCTKILSPHRSPFSLNQMG